jgi:TRAP-type C4-dicarboxylate transport system permease small subunit
MMARGIDLFFKALEGLLVLLLATMVVMVFGNVVLRYLLDTGIDI